MTVQQSALQSAVAFEYRAATEGSAVHDVSHFGRLKASGADALDLLNRLSTNKVVDLQPGQGSPTILTTDRGRILDLVDVVNTGDYVLLITSPGAQQTVIDWLDKYTIMEDLVVEDLTASTRMLAVFGPGSRATVETAARVSLDGLPLFHTVAADVGGCRTRIIHHPLAELPCFYLVASAEDAPRVWQPVVDSGATPVGAETYETVRVLRGIPSHGREIGEEYNPLEAGLIGCIDFAKGCYIGQEVIARLDTYQKVQKYLVTLTFGPGAAVAERAYLVLSGQKVGKVTSVATNPATGEAVGLAYVRKGTAAEGARLELEEPSEGVAEIRGLCRLFGPGQE
jgi:folate-binding protein YgfZ